MARRRASRVRRAILTTVLVAGLACAGVGAWMIAGDQKVFDEYGELAATATSRGAESGAAGEGEDEGPSIDWGALRDINGDVAGWLSVDGTEISMPVTQGSAAWPDKYLYYSFYNERSQIGCPYLNWRCDADGRVMTIYGHHVWYSKRMFNELAYTYEEPNFEELGDAWWSTPATGSKRFQPVGAARISMYEGDEWNKTAFETADDVRAWLREIMGDLDVKSGNAEELANTATRVLVLVTCTGDEGWADTSKRCVTVFADPDPEFADKVLEVTLNAETVRTLAGSASGLAADLRALGSAEGVEATADGGVAAKVTERQLSAWHETAASETSDALSALEAIYPECKASKLPDGSVDVYVPEGDEANWAGIADRATACANASALERALAAAQSDGDTAAAAEQAKVTIWNKESSREVALWTPSAPGGWDVAAWEASR